MNLLSFLLSFAVLLTIAPSASAVSRAVVIVPVADLRSDQSLPPPGQSDAKQQTQLLFGEEVEVVSSSGAWVQVNAIEQPEFTTHERWEGYPGWVLASSLYMDSYIPGEHYIASKWVPVTAPAKVPALSRLPLGARVRLKGHKDAWVGIELPETTGWIPENTLRPQTKPPLFKNSRQEILKTAGILMGDAYVWGGLSPADETRQIRLTGVDCSGLVHLAYRVNGMTVPRDSMDQFLKAQRIERHQLKPADLIFLAKSDDPKKIVHVMLYAGDETVLEAPQTGLPVRKISFQKKLGVPLSTVESGRTLQDRVIYFGRFIED